ncbi:GGDEF domain-containing protein [Aliarcobacter cibarius]|uniref:diguanylate cyclase n=1 Tax=Aliarcobacter cibarius TaxID=255507 RepID=A0A7L5JR39_9BACT|nr:GGDEF domain-containing protein [Aliarcobacter cibarius]QKJ27589.1 diguanylate cyclase [Aliarcobacter cibarius]TLT00628.1 diguanylate cyclase [Aliarcobacter cibarius]TLT00922.1 diguanylate cyclase [Aliarcobacter cibarius]TLT03935.1 diguanylate cyclase [Aliarcobacter cibarius]
MKNIKDITKNTLASLSKNNIATTPENYFIEFNEQAKKFDSNFEELDLFEVLKNSISEVEKEELEPKSYNDLAKILQKRVSAEELKKLVVALNDILKPSVNFDMLEEIEKFITKLLERPKDLTSSDSIKTLKKLSKQRVTNDRQVLKEKTDDIMKLTSLMSRYFDKTLTDGVNSNEEIIKIKDELVALDISKFSHRELRIVQKKLIDTIFKIETALSENKKILSNNKERFDYLNRQIEELQKELSLVKEEHQIDYLTSLLNRRAYDYEVEKMERKYQVFNSNFAIVFYDIDHFKDINDKYGHACGDAVLKSFARILKDLTRKEDVIARYGGEEFVALVHYQDEIEVSRYIKRVKNTIRDTDFIYSNNKIKITFSAGISFRNKYESFFEAKKHADDLLYKAKNQGRDIIFLDNSQEL